MVAAARPRRSGSGAGRPRARSSRRSRCAARSSRNAPSGKMPSPGGRWESHPLPALSDRCTCRIRPSKPPAEVDQVVLGDRGVAGVHHQVGEALEVLQVLVRVERHLATPDPDREHVLDRDRHAGLRRARGESIFDASGGSARCHRYGGCTTTIGTSASAATSIARSTFPIGSVPHTRRVSSRHGAWIAPIVRPCSARAHASGRGPGWRGPW